MGISVGERIKGRRQELGLTQLELAKKMGYTTKSAISNVEQNTDNITTDRLVKFAEALDTTPSYLVGWQSDEANDNCNRPDAAVNTCSPLSKEEAALLEYYRSADEPMKARLLNIAKVLVE